MKLFGITTRKKSLTKVDGVNTALPIDPILRRQRRRCFMTLVPAKQSIWSEAHVRIETTIGLTEAGFQRQVKNEVWNEVKLFLEDENPIITFPSLRCPTTIDISPLNFSCFPKIDGALDLVATVSSRLSSPTLPPLLQHSCEICGISCQSYTSLARGTLEISGRTIPGTYNKLQVLAKCQIGEKTEAKMTMTCKNCYVKTNLTEVKTSRPVTCGECGKEISVAFVLLTNERSYQSFSINWLTCLECNDRAIGVEFEISL